MISFQATSGGCIEVEAKSIEVLGKAHKLPFSSKEPSVRLQALHQLLQVRF